MIAFYKFEEKEKTKFKVGVVSSFSSLFFRSRRKSSSPSTSSRSVVLSCSCSYIFFDGRFSI